MCIIYLISYYIEGIYLFITYYKERKGHSHLYHEVGNKRDCLILMQRVLNIYQQLQQVPYILQGLVQHAGISVEESQRKPLEYKIQIGKLLCLITL